MGSSKPKWYAGASGTQGQNDTQSDGSQPATSTSGPVPVTESWVPYAQTPSQNPVGQELTMAVGTSGFAAAHGGGQAPTVAPVVTQTATTGNKVAPTGSTTSLAAAPVGMLAPSSTTSGGGYGQWPQRTQGQPQSTQAPLPTPTVQVRTPAAPVVQPPRPQVPSAPTQPTAQPSLRRVPRAQTLPQTQIEQPSVSAPPQIEPLPSAV
ncbi:hypothetical protein PI124_g16548 [Phytophthora idaei]|nr:hypothetical protein PI125_g13682 [Phytophthora idaei]KAG3145608.1 hypothetical protein PI126_g13668 [Phytophthora idaei]KAG3238493.1 hypothetical protein PI124_g16548 [Phytophthora idaei]